MYNEILTALKNNRTRFGPIKVFIDTGGIGGRYRAFINTPNYNTMVGTPDLVDIEGILTFYERIASKLVDVLYEYKLYESKW